MIEIYGSENCSKCKMIVSKLEAKNIEHTYSINQDEVISASVLYKTRMLPICVMGGEYKEYMDMNNWINRQIID